MEGGIRTDSLKITPQVLRLIAEIDEFKGAWAAVGRLSPERLRNLRRVATIEGVGSSTRIEGARLSDAEVERLLGGPEMTAPVSRDEEEVAGYARALETVFSNWQDMTLTENHIRQLHRELFRYSSKDAGHRGEYRTHPHQNEAFGPGSGSLGVVFKAAAPFDTPRLMRELIEWTRTGMASGELHALICITVFIAVMLEIHPFQDGNGRLSRILANLLLLRAGYAYVPCSSLEFIIEQNKETYYLALRQTQDTLHTESPDWQPWLLFFLRSLHQQKARLEREIARERLLLGDLPELSVQILEQCRENGRVTVAMAAKASGASRNTIKDHFRALVRARHLVRHGAGRGTWYGLS
ncbi:Fic family protein [Pseudomonadota bacterium]|jgi:Fic family protein|nr:Fic family protein [Xanthomonadales bacterium]